MTVLDGALERLAELGVKSRALGIPARWPNEPMWEHSVNGRTAWRNEAQTIQFAEDEFDIFLGSIRPRP